MSTNIFNLEYIMIELIQEDISCLLRPLKSAIQFLFILESLLITRDFDPLRQHSGSLL